jgi:hypothetical protein
MAENVFHNIVLKATEEDEDGNYRHVVTVSGLEEFLMEVKDATGGYDNPVITVDYSGLSYEYEEN